MKSTPRRSAPLSGNFVFAHLQHILLVFGGNCLVLCNWTQWSKMIFYLSYVKVENLVSLRLEKKERKLWIFINRLLDRQTNLPSCSDSLLKSLKQLTKDKWCRVTISLQVGGQHTQTYPKSIKNTFFSTFQLNWYRWMDRRPKPLIELRVRN